MLNKFLLPCGTIKNVWKNRNGYLVCKLNGKNKPIHRVVYEHFNGEIKNNLTVNHKDGKKLNNDISNLELMTFSENAKHSWENGLARPCKGQNHGRSILDDIKVLAIITCPRRSKNGKGHGVTNKELSDLFGVSVARINAIKNGREWKHIHDLIKD
jgi:hypothetical protein